MSSILQEELRRQMTERARQAELLRRRKAFVDRLRERQITEPPKEQDRGILNTVMPDILDRAVSQIATAIKETPAGLMELVRAPVLDVKDLVTQGDFTPERTAGIGKAMATGVYEDFRHPLRNPGYLFLDLIGIGRTPITAAARVKEGVQTYQALRRGEEPPQPRDPLPHGNPPPSQGGFSGAVAHPQGRVRDPDVPREGEPGFDWRPPASKVETRDLVQGAFAVVADPKLRQQGVVARQTRPMLDGTVFELQQDPRTRSYRVVRLDRGKRGNAQPVGDLIADPRQAWLHLGGALKMELVRQDFHPDSGVRRAVRQTGQPKEAKDFLRGWHGDDRIRNVSPDEIREDLNLWFDLPQPPKPRLEKPLPELSPVERVGAMREWVKKNPGEMVTVGTLRSRFGLRTSDAKQLRDTLVAEKVINRSGKVAKSALDEVVPQAAFQPAKRLEQGTLGPDDIPDFVPQKYSKRDLKEMRQRIEDDDYDPVELRRDKNDTVYVHDNDLVVLAARQMWGEGWQGKIRFELTEAQEVPKGVLPGLKLGDADRAKPRKQLSPEAQRKVLDQMAAEAAPFLPTAAQIEKVLGLKPKEAAAARAELAARAGISAKLTVGEKPPPQPQPPVALKASKRSPQDEFKAAQRLVYEDGATAATIARKLGVSESRAKRLLTQVNKDRAGKKNLVTPHELRQARSKIEKLWDEKGMMPTLRAATEATGLGRTRAMRLLAEVRDARKQQRMERARQTQGRTSDAATGMEAATLKAAGVPEAKQPALRAAVKELHKQFDPPDQAMVADVFRQVLGKKAGEQAYTKWRQSWVHREPPKLPRKRPEDLITWTRPPQTSMKRTPAEQKRAERNAAKVQKRREGEKPAYTEKEVERQLAQVEKLVDGDKVPTIADIRRKTGVGYIHAKNLQRQVAEKLDLAVQARQTLRDQGTNARALGVNARALSAAGVPDQFQGPIRKGITALHERGKPTQKALLDVFRTHLGDAAGKAAYRRWQEARIKSGGAAAAAGMFGPRTQGEALREAFKVMRQPLRGGTYPLAIVTRRRGVPDAAPEDVFDPKTGERISPGLEIVSPEEAPSVGQRQLVQRKKHERLLVEAALADDPILRKFQLHRYKWMAKEQSTRVARVYARLIRADNIRPDSSALKHVRYQLRELDRAAQAIADGRVKPLAKSGLRQAIAQAYKERAEAVEKRVEHETSAGGELGRKIDTVNQLAIITTLFLKPAYLTPNLLGQAFLVTADHFLNPLRLLESMRLRQAVFANKRQREIVRSAMHEGMIGSLDTAPGASAKISGVHHTMALYYSRLMDDWFREVSFMNEARRHGFDTPEKLSELLTNENLQGKLVEVSRRANMNIIDFGRMGPWGRSVLRRAIFFYPWIRASALYTARFPFQHPLQSTAYVQAAKEGQERREREIGPVPSYLEGSFRGPNIDLPFFGNLGERTMPDGSKQPRIINPAAASIFSGLGEIMAAIKANGLGQVRESEQLSDFLSPAIQLTGSVVMRRDPFTGREFPDDMGTVEILGQEASQYVALIDTFRDIRQSRKFETGERDPDEVLFPYTPTERLGRFTFGISPYTLNRKEARSRAAAESRGLEAKSRRELLKYQEKREELLRNAKEVGLLPPSATQLPQVVRDAFTVRARREANLAAFEAELGRDLTNVDRLYADVSLLVRMKKIPQRLAEAILESAKTLPDPMVDTLSRRLREAHFGTRAISQYTQLVNARRMAMGKELISG